MKSFCRPSSAPKAWSSAELQQLRSLVLEGVAIDTIATRLHRSVSAIRNKAGMHGISLASTQQRGTDVLLQPAATQHESHPPSWAATVPGYADI